VIPIGVEPNGFNINDGVGSTRPDAAARLEGSGRLVIRKSGTEPLIRVMAEAEDDALMRAVVDEVADAVRSAGAG
jgi:phosphoglucosamine mutase